MRHGHPHTPKERVRRKLYSHAYPKLAAGLGREGFLANGLTSRITAMEMLTEILNALGDSVQCSDGKESKFLW